MIAKPISTKDAKRKFGGCAQKAVELISGDDACALHKQNDVTGNMPANAWSKDTGRWTRTGFEAYGVGRASN